MSSKKYGVLVISHGSRSADWVRLVDEAVEGVSVPEGVPVFSSYLELVEDRLIQDGIYALEGQGVTDLIVIPLFVSSGSTHIDEIRYALGVTDTPTLPTDMIPFRIKARIHCTDPIDDDESIAEIVSEKLEGVSIRPDREVLLLIGHGSAEEGFYERWRDGLERLAERVRLLRGFAAADVAMLLPDQAAARLEHWQKEQPDWTVVAAPLFLSEGYFTNQVIPKRLGGAPYRYNGRALLPHPLVSRWMERQLDPFFR
jgi:sirohydrochlorin ferrochelatase